MWVVSQFDCGEYRLFLFPDSRDYGGHKRKTTDHHDNKYRKAKYETRATEKLYNAKGNNKHYCRVKDFPKELRL